MSGLYHETVPDDESPKRYIGRCYDAERIMQIPVKEPDWCFGPLPSTSDEALALACEVQFARMEVAWIMKSPFRLSSNDIRASYADSRVRFAIEGERSLSLYRDMERVTKELGG